MDLTKIFRAGHAGTVRPAAIERGICRTEKAGEGRNLGHDRWKGTGGLPEWGLLKRIP